MKILMFSLFALVHQLINWLGTL